jgi:predicted  nucleic acid-binding Zn-ribbon protein
VLTRKKRNGGKNMQRKFLKDMGLTDEQIEQIMKENGNDITREQGVANTYKTQLTELEGKLKDFDGVDVSKLKGEIATLTADLTKTKSTYENQISDMQFTAALEGKVSALKPRNTKAVMALLDVENLKKSKNQDTDINTALEALKKDNGYLFEEGKTNPRVVTGNQTTNDNTDKKAAANEAFRSLFKSE